MDGFDYGFVPSSGFLPVDARDPAAPKLATVFPRQEEDPYSSQIAAWPLVAEDGFLYLRMHGGIHIYNASHPYALSLEGVYSPPQTRARGPFMDAKLGTNPTLRQLEAERARDTFIAHQEFPFESFPFGRRHTENAELLGAALHDALLFARKGYAYCVGPKQEVKGNYVSRERGSPTPFYGPARREVEDGGLWVLDFSDPAEPLAVGFLPLQFRYGRNGLPDVAVSSDYLYLTSQGSLSEEAAILDLSEPSKPVLSEWQLNASFVVREDSQLFVSIVHGQNMGFFNPSGYSHGLQVFDVSDAANPILIAMMSQSLGTGGKFVWISDIVFRGDYISVAIFDAENSCEADGIHVLRLIDLDWRPDDRPAEASDN